MGSAVNVRDGEGVRDATCVGDAVYVGSPGICVGTGVDVAVAVEEIDGVKVTVGRFAIMLWSSAIAKLKLPHRIKIEVAAVINPRIRSR